MTTAHESLPQESERLAFALLLDETRMLSEKLLERIEDLFEQFPSVELHKAIMKLHSVQESLPE